MHTSVSIYVKCTCTCVKAIPVLSFRDFLKNKDDFFYLFLSFICDIKIVNVVDITFINTPFIATLYSIFNITEFNTSEEKMSLYHLITNN